MQIARPGIAKITKVNGDVIQQSRAVLSSVNRLLARGEQMSVGWKVVSDHGKRRFFFTRHLHEHERDDTHVRLVQVFTDEIHELREAHGLIEI